MTAQFGARYIASAVSFSIAAHAVLDAYATVIASAARRPDAVVVGCFGDPGMDGLREISGVPVVGFAESGILAATARPGRFLIATVGLVWRDRLAGMARQHGIEDRLVGTLAIDQLAADPARAAQEIDERAEELKADRVVIGGTGLIPVIPKIAARLKVELLDPHRVAIRDAIAQAQSHAPGRTPQIDGIATQFNGLSPALQQMLGSGVARSHA
jgi:Asp/Glu/hydantoin racemase